MENTIKTTPKDVFLHLLNILTFYISVIGFITVNIQYINALFPDPLNFYFTSIATTIQWASSLLIIGFPVYLLTSWLLAKDIAGNPPKREMKLRKWLLYFTLFISAVTVIVDLIIFVYNFLGGDLTIKFALKVFVVLFVAAAVFGYYIWELRRKETASKTPKTLAWILSLVVVASIVSGFFIVGTPGDQRRMKFDEQRINHLQELQGQIINFWQQKGTLPENLDQLENSLSGFEVRKDPKTEEPYGYSVKSEFVFELCANFETSTSDSKYGPMRQKSYYPYYDAMGQNWEHDQGRKCFERVIDPELYNIKDGIKPIPIGI